MRFDSKMPIFPSRPNAAGTFAERLRFQEGVGLEKLRASQSDPTRSSKGRVTQNLQAFHIRGFGK
jgi:hypothetical protein